MASSCPEHYAPEIFAEVFQHVEIAGTHRVRRDTRNLGDDVLDVVDTNGLFTLARRLQPALCACLVDHVDRLVGQMTVVDVARRGSDRVALRSACSV